MFVQIVLALSLLAAHAFGGPPRSGAGSDTGVVEVESYTLTTVGASSPGRATGSTGLSNSGFVTGSLSARGEREVPLGYRWAPGADSAPGSLLVPDGSSWAGSSAVDVNDSGTLVGSFGEHAAFLTRGYRWQDGVIEELLTPLGQRAFPLALNDAGWIVGYAGIQPAGTPGAVLWSPELEPRFVADLTRAVDINARGQVIGVRNDAAGIARGFLWSEGELIPLGSLDPRGLGAVYPKAIDAAGRVVGVSLIRGRAHAFRWSRAGGMRELFAPRTPSSSATSQDVAALDLNDAGWAVGYSKAAGGEGALLWAPDGSVRALAALVPELAAAGAGTLRVERINAAGQIAGSLSKAGEVRTVLLTPAPARTTTRIPGAVGMLLR